MRKLRTVLTLAFLGLAVGPLLILGGTLSWLSYSTQLDSAHRYCQMRADNTALKIEEMLLDLERYMLTLSRFKNYFELGDTEKRDLARELMVGEPMLRELTLLDAQGKQLFRLSSVRTFDDSKTVSWKGTMVFTIPLHTKSTYFGPIQLEMDSAEHLVNMSVPMFDLRTGDVRLVLVATVRLKSMWDILVESSSNEHERVLVTSGDGRVLAHPNPSVGLSCVRALVFKGKQLQKGVSGEYVVAAEKIIRIGRNQFTIISEWDAEAALKPFFQSSLFFVVVSCVTLVLALMFGYLARNKLVGPIENLTETARAIRNGDLSAQARMEHFYETSELAQTFNAMTTRILGSMSKLEDEVQTRKQTEIALAKSQERLDLGLNAVSDGLWDWTVKTGMVYFSDRFCEMLEYGAGEVGPGYSAWIAMLNPEDAARYIGEVDAHLKKGVELSSEIRLLTRSGDWKWVLIRGKVVARDAKGAPERMVGTMVDIDARKRAEDIIHGLFESMAGSVGHAFFDKIAVLLRELLKADVSFVGEIDTEQGRVDALAMHVDEEIVKSFTYDLPGTPCEEVVNSGVCTYLQDVQKLFPHVPEFAKLGAEAYIGAPLMNSQGACVGVTYVLSRAGFKYVETAEQVMGILAKWAAAEVERMRGERELRMAKERAEEASSTKSEFLANMSHELRTPLNGAMGLLQLLLTTDLNAEQVDYINLAMGSCKNLTQLLCDILDLSRVEAGRLELVDISFKLADVLDTLRPIYQESAQQKGLAFSIEVASDVPELLRGDPGRLRQIIFNLVGNAFKFTEAGEVSLSVGLLPIARENEHQLLFIVKDTGVGIPTEKVETIFDPFTQVDGSYTRKFQGAGLGLAIVERLVDLKGGSLTIDSEQNKGTEVFVSLPYGSAGAQELDAAAETMATGQQAKKEIPCVLLAEDDPVNQFATRRLLEKMGYEVVLAENGRLALEALGTHTFDFILMDVQMPVMSGVEATRAIRTFPEFASVADIPIIALTAYAMSGDREKILEAGMNDYLTKPFDMGKLTEVLDKFMDEKN